MADNTPNKNEADTLKPDSDKTSKGRIVALCVTIPLIGVLLGATWFGLNLISDIPKPVGTTATLTTVAETTDEPATVTTEQITELTTELTTGSTTQESTMTTTGISSTAPSATKAPTTEEPEATLPQTDATKPHTEAPFVSSSIVAFNKKPVSGGTGNTILALVERYPSLLSYSVLGESADGRNIYLMKLGNGERKALFIAGIHAREYITINYLLLCVEEYCEAYENGGEYGDYDICELLDNYTLYIVPDCNPDGTEISLGRGNPLVDIPSFSRSNYKANANGVDLNRNFPLGWDAIDNGVYAPANYFFKGYEEGSEQETQLIMSLCNSHRFEFAISFHVAGECVYWGDTYDTSNNSSYKAFAKKITDVTGFYLTGVSKNKDTYGGGFENWFRHEYSRPGLCVELVSYKDLDYPVRDSAFTNFKSAVKWNSTRYIIPESLS